MGVATEPALLGVGSLYKYGVWVFVLKDTQGTGLAIKHCDSEL